MEAGTRPAPGPTIPPELLDPSTEDERTRRNRMLYQMKVLRSLTNARVGEMFNLSERTVKRIVAEYREREAVWTLDIAQAREFVADNLAIYEDTLEQASLAAASADNTAARVGALNLRLRAVHERTQMLQELGVLPKDLGQFTVRLDLEEAAGRLVEVFRRFGVAQDVQDAAVQAMLGSPDHVLPATTVEGTVVEPR